MVCDRECINMTTSGETTGEATKQFLLDCEECSFERTVTGRDEVIRVGDNHREETDHELTALELPQKP